MSLTRLITLGAALLLSAGCSDDHYEGGGRRRELPTSQTAQAPPVTPGEPSTTGGSTSIDVDPGLAGAFVE
jgi:hypothetical protein